MVLLLLMMVSAVVFGPMSSVQALCRRLGRIYEYPERLCFRDVEKNVLIFVKSVMSVAL